MANVYVYTKSPIDFEWDYILHLEDYVFRAVRCGHYHKVWSVINLFAHALRSAEACEGDIGQGPCVTFIPNDDDEMQLVVLWKQNNNGTTFCASYEPIMSLEVDSVIKVIVTTSHKGA